VTERVHVAVGGGLGSLARGGVVLAALALAPGAELVAVLLLNLLGAFALGWLAGRARVDVRWRRLVPLVGTGFLGALTTFSALAEQVADAVLRGEVVLVAALSLVSLGAGVASALAGLRVGLRTPEDASVSVAPPGLELGSDDPETEFDPEPAPEASAEPGDEAGSEPEVGS
jgi:fluoride exporter